MTSTRNIFVILLIFILSGDSFGAALYRLKRSQNEYILRRCIASVQLIRTHVVTSNPVQSVSSDVQKEDARRPNVRDATMEQQNYKRIRVHDRSQDNYTSTGSKDTPLKTVNIQAIQKDRPLIFKKKYPLPELQRNVTSGIPEMSTNVIVIKP